MRVIQPGIFTTVQDQGRRGLQQYGVPVSGAMDAYSFRLANKLLGNADDAAALEVTLSGPVLEAEENIAVAVTGGEVPVTINGAPTPMWQTSLLQAGDQLEVGSVTAGARVYIAVAGGFDVPLIMGSRATFARGNIGGIEGRALRSGDKLPLGRTGLLWSELAGRFVPREFQARLPIGVTRVRIVLGPQEDYFTTEALKQLATATYSVGQDSDRMAYRLDGAKLAHCDKADIVSDGIAPGSIQVPGHGLPIVMLADRGTTGGYPKIATVISADLPLLGQMRPGTRLCFEVVTYAEAVEALRQQESVIASQPCLGSNFKKLNVNVNGETFVTDVWQVKEV